MGIGNEFNGDDAAGVIIATNLISAFEQKKILNIQVLDAGQFPENITGTLRSFSPKVIIFIDAVNMNAKPGFIAWIPFKMVSGMSASSHSLPISILADYLSQDLKCEVYLLGIQAEQNEPFQPLSSQVYSAVSEITETLHNSCS